MKFLSAIFASLFAANLMASWLPSLFGSKHDDARSALVEKGALNQKITVAGTVVPLRRTVFTPPYNAYVKKIYVKIGEHVAAGSPVVALTQSLRGSEEVYPLRAPFGGTVVQIPRSEGEYVELGKENNIIVRIDDMSKLLVYSDVAEAEMTKIKIGQPVLVRANAVSNRVYKGVIRNIALASKEKKEWSRTSDRVEYEVRMEILDKDAQILPGMSAIVDVITNQKDQVLLLPIEYVEKRDGKFWATLADGRRTEIQVGLQNEEKFEIVSGIKEGDRVLPVDFFNLPSKMN